MKAIVIMASLLLASLSAQAINKCTGPDGGTIFQDAPCQGKGGAITVRPASGHATKAASDGAHKAKADLAAVNKRIAIREAIESRQPLVGMTIAELDQAMGPPQRANLADYNGRQHNQLIYERAGRTLYVYTDGGLVKAIQNTESVGASSRPKRRCLSGLEIRNMETAASSITISEAERVERLRQIGEEKKCSN